MTEQWQELKETIIELRDNDGTGTQQEVCKFLANLIDVLEKQMQEPCEELDFVQPHKKVSVNLKVCKMREATQKEREGVEQYIDSIAEECEDAISREKTMQIVRKWFDRNAVPSELKNEIEQIPPVTLKQRTGHWFVDERPESNRETICSNCEQPVFKFHKLDFDYRPNYCPNCGAKMQ